MAAWGGGEGEIPKHAPDTRRKGVARAAVRCPADERKRLFEKFTRAPESMGNSSGLGLGLYIVAKILESHGQEITVSGEVGKGTTFEFHLPVVS